MRDGLSADVFAARPPAGFEEEDFAFGEVGGGDVPIFMRQDAGRMNAAFAGKGGARASGGGASEGRESGLAADRLGRLQRLAQLLGHRLGRKTYPHMRAGRAAARCRRRGRHHRPSARLTTALHTRSDDHLALALRRHLRDSRSSAHPSWVGILIGTIGLSRLSRSSRWIDSAATRTSCRLDFSTRRLRQCLGLPG